MFSILNKIVRSPDTAEASVVAADAAKQAANALAKKNIDAKVGNVDSVDVSGVNMDAGKVETTIAMLATDRDAQMNEYDGVYIDYHDVVAHPDNFRHSGDASFVAGVKKWSAIFADAGYKFALNPPILSFDESPKIESIKIGKRTIRVLRGKASALRGNIRLTGVLPHMAQSSADVLRAILPDGRYVPVSYHVGLSVDAQRRILFGDHQKNFAGVKADWRERLATGIALMANGVSQFQIGEYFDGKGNATQHIGQQVARIKSFDPVTRDYILNPANEVSQGDILKLYNASREDAGGKDAPAHRRTVHGPKYDAVVEQIKGGGVSQATWKDLADHVASIISAVRAGAGPDSAMFRATRNLLEPLASRDKAHMAALVASLDEATKGTFPSDFASLVKTIPEIVHTGNEKSEARTEGNDNITEPANDEPAIVKPGKAGKRK
jgi:hypothetical protein